MEVQLVLIAYGGKTRELQCLEVNIVGMKEMGRKMME